MAVRDRLHRSELAVPGSNTRAMEKAPGLGADVVFLDLEDAVAPDDKEQARENVIAALTGQDWSACSVSVRINGLDTHWCYRDIVEVVERAGSQLDTILIPKVGTPADVLFVATMLDQIEAAFGLEPINLHILIETALGMANVEAIAQTCPERLEAMVFGVADYAASTQARTTNIGGSNPDYVTLTHAGESGVRERHWGDQWHFALSRMVVACRAYGLRPIDGPFGDYQDPDGLHRRRAQRSPARLRGQVGDPPLPDRARERGVHAVTGGDRPRPPDHRGDAAGGGRGQGRRLAGRQADRRRVDQDGREHGAQGRPDAGRRRVCLRTLATRQSVPGTTARCAPAPRPAAPAGAYPSRSRALSTSE